MCAVLIPIYTFCRYLFKTEKSENENRLLKLEDRPRITPVKISNDQIYFKNIPPKGFYCGFFKKISLQLSFKTSLIVALKKDGLY